MSKTENAGLKLLKSKLNKLMKIILEELSENQSFRQKLEDVLIESQLKVSTSKISKSDTKLVKGRKTMEKFSPVSVLHEQGEGKLRESLLSKTDAELQTIMKAEGIRKARELKTIERQQMIDEIVQDASRRLNHGIIVSGISQK